jgi:hypothetical protein
MGLPCDFSTRRSERTSNGRLVPGHISHGSRITVENLLRGVLADRTGTWMVNRYLVSPSSMLRKVAPDAFESEGVEDGKGHPR